MAASRIKSSLLILLFSTFATGIAQSNASRNQAHLEITYIANYGALQQAGGNLCEAEINGLFRQGVAGYARLPKATLQTLEAAKPPFDQIDVLLVSHPHDDHSMRVRWRHICAITAMLFCFHRIR